MSLCEINKRIFRLDFVLKFASMVGEFAMLVINNYPTVTG